MSSFGRYRAADKHHTAEELAQLLARYDINAFPHALLRLFKERWSTVSMLAHAIHNEQERERIQADQNAIYLYSPEHEEQSG